MARQWNIFGFRDGDKPDPANEISIGYEADKTGTPIRLRLPAGEKLVPASKAGELGILLLALAGDKLDHERAFELLQGFDLHAPFFLHLDLLAKRVARQIVESLIDTFPAIRGIYGDNASKRSEFEAAIARKITTVLRQNA